MMLKNDNVYFKIIAVFIVLVFLLLTLNIFNTFF